MGRPSPTLIAVEVPPRAEHVHVLRSVVASVAARLDLPYDGIEDLKIAVDEACAHLLGAARGTTLRLTVRAWANEMEVAATIDDREAIWPPEGFESSLTWHVLTALTDDASFEQDGGPVLRFTKRTLERQGG